MLERLESGGSGSIDWDSTKFSKLPQLGRGRERGEGGEGVMMVIEEEGVSRDGIQKLIITIKSACMKFQLLKLRLVHESV